MSPASSHKRAVARALREIIDGKVPATIEERLEAARLFINVNNQIKDPVFKEKPAETKKSATPPPKANLSDLLSE